ncbi:thiosulfate/3-mercaptopyruvate sulfurtransferase [Brevibacterium sanguinis]|uniref:Thiosulfate/3-mercaptopyruvate sulfurtransferase n=2 Tax=Brevibacterium TaxID=1696 RepID=A0A366IMW1_9MICO|nr:MULTISPECIES: sulfurtransferase [Brevibacterium]RBP68160.1 thiosulfate/3-mercaptopyruvate sulfurtransferase [Brevibacterium sanguinis]RBP74423.1 thiosulfate/3-mercaptopyruvate sulfurtransferase [Brevibacterium celere]
MTRADVLITAEELLEKLTTGSAPRLLDVRWTLTKPDGRDDFAAGHIPGAVYVDLDTELADHSATDPTAGRHPLPSPERFEQQVRRWGIDALTDVVVYDDNSALGAARAWWLLRWAGLNARVLDGGLRAWLEAGGELETGPGATVDPSTVTISAGSLPVIDADAAAAFDGVLLDARAKERFRGEVEPLDPRAGHIPGAKSAPATDNTSGGRFLDDAALRARFAELGALEQPVGVYCGSGVTACHNALALATLGVDSVLYPASWSGWSSDPARPVETE